MLEAEEEAFINRLILRVKEAPAEEAMAAIPL
jgi:hypothetical protein